MNSSRRGPVAPLPIVGYRKNGAPIYPIAGGDGTDTRNPVLVRILDEREAKLTRMDAILAEADKAERGLSDEETTELTEIRDRVTAIDSQAELLNSFEATRSTAHRQGAPRMSSAPQPSDRQSLGGGAFTQPREHEYASRGEVIRDLLLAAPSSDGAMRLGGGPTGISSAQREAAIERMQGAGVIYPGAPAEYVQERIAHQTTADLPGLLPKPIVGAVESDLDAARPFVESIGAKPLGTIAGKTFSRPTVTQHTEVGKQEQEKGELPSRVYKVGGVDFTKETYGGALNVSRQSIDWTSPSAWDALLTDLQEVYAIETEGVAAKAFAAAVTATVGAPADDNLKGWARALYAAAAAAYGGASRLPNHIWVSLDMWVEMGAIVDAAKMSLRNGDGASLGGSSPTNFAGHVLDLPRSVVPGLPEGTVIVGVKEKTEFYEERIGLLSAVEPRVLGIEIAYGGDIAYGTLKPAAFAKIEPVSDGVDDGVEG